MINALIIQHQGCTLSNQNAARVSHRPQLKPLRGYTKSQMSSGQPLLSVILFTTFADT